jgi:DNA mismatch repair protein MSH4
MLKSFVQAVPPVYEALTGARAELLAIIRENCRPEAIRPTVQYISEVINDDVIYSKQPIDLRNQRTYAVKVGRRHRGAGRMLTFSQSGVNGLLDVARQTFKEATEEYISM